MEDMVSSLSSACSRGCEDLSHVLCLQDTTEIVFSHEGRLSLDDKDFGYGTSEKEKYCIFAHPGLVVDAASRMPVGYGHIKVWSRDRSENRQKKQRRGKVKLEAKESYRWVETAEKTVASLPSGVRVTMVGDRENDVYSVMCKTLACGCDFLVRSVHDRPVDCDVDGGSMGIKAYMQSRPVALTYNLEPVYSIILAMLIFQEYHELNFSFVLGIALIIVSVVLQTWSKVRVKNPA